jgi:hypothetical protein
MGAAPASQDAAMPQASGPGAGKPPPLPEPVEARGTAEGKVREPCALPGCNRSREYEPGCEWGHCCKDCFITDGGTHTATCDQRARREEHLGQETVFSAVVFNVASDYTEVAWQCVAGPVV